jgi:hypothetical protein
MTLISHSVLVCCRGVPPTLWTTEGSDVGLSLRLCLNHIQTLAIAHHEIAFATTATASAVRDDGAPLTKKSNP